MCTTCQSASNDLYLVFLLAAAMQMLQLCTCHLLRLHLNTLPTSAENTIVIVWTITTNVISKLGLRRKDTEYCEAEF